MSRSVLDTNALLRFLLNDIPSQVALIEEKIKEAKVGKLELIIPQIVIFEIAYALTKAYGFGKEEVIKGLKKIITAKEFRVLDKEIFIQVLDIYKLHKVSFSDCFIAAFARQSSADLFTFDNDLKKLVKSS